MSHILTQGIITLQDHYFGNGSLNNTNEGYNSLVKLNGTIRSGSYQYPLQDKGNCDNLPDVRNNLGSGTRRNNPSGLKANSAYILAGLQTYNLASNVYSAADRSVLGIDLYNGALTGSNYYSQLQLCLNGTYYSLNDAISAALIEPLVLILSWKDLSAGYRFASPLNILLGTTSSTGTIAYSMFQIICILKANVTFSGFKLYSNIASNTNATYQDGYQIWSFPFSSNQVTL